MLYYFNEMYYKMRYFVKNNNLLTECKNKKINYTNVIN